MTNYERIKYNDLIGEETIIPGKGLKEYAESLIEHYDDPLVKETLYRCCAVYCTKYLIKISMGNPKMTLEDYYSELYIIMDDLVKRHKYKEGYFLMTVMFRLRGKQDRYWKKEEKERSFSEDYYLPFEDTDSHLVRTMKKILTKQEYEILDLYYIAKLDIKLIAKSLGLTPTIIKVISNSAIKKLKEELNVGKNKDS